MVCTFFGHRNTDSSILPRLREAIIDLIENKNVSVFYVGNNGMFDFFVREELKEIKKKYPHIKYYIVLAYMPEGKSEFETFDYSDTICFSLPEKTPRRFFVDKRNRIMIQKADYVITHVTTVVGGAAKYKELAKKQNKIVIEI